MSMFSIGRTQGGQYSTRSWVVKAVTQFFAWGNIAGTLADQTDLQDALDAKAASSHTHAIANVTGLQTALDGKAASAHTHEIANVTGLQTIIDDFEARIAALEGP